MAKIMLVEDDNNLREIYEARLLAEGYEIVSAKDGEEALALAVKEKPDLIISDVMMPKISGFDMLDILRSTPETKNTKVIMMTALSQAEDKARADKLGADRYLVKSQVTLEDVAKVASEVLNDEAPAGHPSPPTNATAATDTPVATQSDDNSTNDDSNDDGSSSMPPAPTTDPQQPSDATNVTPPTNQAQVVEPAASTSMPAANEPTMQQPASNDDTANVQNVDSPEPAQSSAPQPEPVQAPEPAPAAPAQEEEQPVVPETPSVEPQTPASSAPEQSGVAIPTGLNPELAQSSANEQDSINQQISQFADNLPAPQPEPVQAPEPAPAAPVEQPAAASMALPTEEAVQNIDVAAPPSNDNESGDAQDAPISAESANDVLEQTAPQPEPVQAPEPAPAAPVEQPVVSETPSVEPQTPSSPTAPEPAPANDTPNAPAEAQPEQSNVIEPTAPAAPTEQSTSTSGTQKKVIQPLNDPSASKAPQLEELAAQEEARQQAAAGIQPPTANTTIQPNENAQASTQNQAQNPDSDDPNSIAL